VTITGPGGSPAPSVTVQFGSGGRIRISSVEPLGDGAFEVCFVMPANEDKVQVAVTTASGDVVTLGL